MQTILKWLGNLLAPPVFLKRGDNIICDPGNCPTLLGNGKCMSMVFKFLCRMAGDQMECVSRLRGNGMS